LLIGKLTVASISLFYNIIPGIYQLTNHRRKLDKTGGLQVAIIITPLFFRQSCRIIGDSGDIPRQQYPQSPAQKTNRGVIIRQPPPGKSKKDS